MSRFSAKWDEFFALDLFKPLEGDAPYEDGDALVGLMRTKCGQPFEYWIGVFRQSDFSVPCGYQSVDFAPMTIGVCLGNL